MNHDPALVSAYHDGVLPPSKRRQVESHLRACPACRALLQEYQQLKKGLEALPWGQAPPGMLGEIRAQVAAERLRRRRLAWLGPLAGVTAAAVAAAAAFFVGTLLPSNQPSSQPERRPVVAFAVPAPGVGQLPQEAVIELHFEAPVDRGAVEQSIAVSPPVPARLEWDDEKLRIVPDGKLDPDTEYTISVAPSGPEPAPSPYTLRLRTVAPPSGLPAPAVEATPSGSALAQTAPTPTATPTSPQPTATVLPLTVLSTVVGRSAPACTVAPSTGLTRLAHEQPDLLRKLGCAAAPETPAPLVEQAFELGVLVWRGDLGYTYAMQSRPRRWISFSDATDDFGRSTFPPTDRSLAGPSARSAAGNGRPAFFLTATATPGAVRELPTEPAATFIRLWRLHPDLRSLIGGPARRERQGAGIVQEFQHGLALVTDWGAVYTVYGDRTWDYLPEPDDTPHFRR